MAEKRRAVALIVGASIVGAGYALMKLTVPKKDALMQRMSDDLTDPKRLSKIERQNEELMQVIQNNIASKDPIWKLKNLKDVESK